MREILSSRYKLRELSSSNDSDFSRALAIYAKNVAPELRTSSNEIAHWLDHYGEKDGDRLHLCCFYVNDEVAGFCQFVFLAETGIAAIDYMVIDEPFRRGLNVFFEFVQHLETLLERRYPDLSATVAEIAGGDSSGPDDASLIRLLKMRGFAVIGAPYVQPRLGLNNKQTELPASLLMFPKPLVGSIPRDRYISIVEAIYLKHYLRWYSIYGETYARDYEIVIRGLLQRVIEGARTDPIVVNGLTRAPTSVTTARPIRDHRLTFQISAAMVALLLTLAASLWLKKASGIDMPAFLVVLFAILLVFFLIASLFSERAGKALPLLERVLKNLLTHEQNVSGAGPDSRKTAKKSIAGRKTRRYRDTI